MNINEIGFLDIETIPAWKNLKDVPLRRRELFKKKFQYKLDLLDPKDNEHDLAWELIWNDNAALYAEFNQIVCMSMGTWIYDKPEDPKCVTGKFYIKAYCGPDEKKILMDAVGFIEKAGRTRYCAHNGFDFDFPIIQKKFWMHGFIVPDVFKIGTRKPWEVSLEDTIQLWKGTELRGKVSLDLVCDCLGIPSSKEEVDGSMVKELSYAGKFEDIANYCNGDVKANVLVYCKLTAQPEPIIEFIPFK